MFIRRSALTAFFSTCLIALPANVWASPVNENVGMGLAEKAQRIRDADTTTLSLSLDVTEDETSQGDLSVVPIPMINPTLGGGGAVVAMYNFGNSSRRSSIGAGGGATSNGSWLGGAGGTLHLGRDRLRISAFGGVGKVHLKYYGVGPGSIFAKHPIEFAGKGWAIAVKPEMRIAKSTYLGVIGQYLDADIETELPIDVLPDIKTPFRFYGIGPIVEFDTRDSGWWPKSGVHLTSQWVHYNEKKKIFGIDIKTKFDVFEIGLAGYLPIAENMVFAGKLRGSGASENTPFFMKPSISFRGFSQGEVLDSNVVEAQGEVRWMASKKWGFVAFAGAGSTGSKFGTINDVSWGAGAGVRYTVAEADRINMAVDVARGNGAWNLYFSIGEAF